MVHFLPFLNKNRPPMRIYKRFSLEGANFRICSTHIQPIQAEIKQQRSTLIDYIHRHPQFMDALAPIQLLKNPPEIVKQMDIASRKVGIGPMASVAGIMAQLAAKAGLEAGATEAIVENGGDIYLHSEQEVIIGIYAKGSSLSGKLAYLLKPAQMPISICSSSSQMGHSLSFGNCNLATVFAKNAALADAAATYTCNSVKNQDDVNPVLEEIVNIQGISGILIIKDDHIGLVGEVPELVKIADFQLADKITMDKQSSHTICLN